MIAACRRSKCEQNFTKCEVLFTFLPETSAAKADCIKKKPKRGGLQSVLRTKHCLFMKNE